MGIERSIEDYEKSVLESLNLIYKGLTWCELGNQKYYTGIPAKSVYAAREVLHTSIDINGRHGAVPLDLDYPVPLEFENRFNVLTNYGTTEHINNQYSVFKNIHTMCKLNGVMIHTCPYAGHWRKHGRYDYGELFFQQLATLCSYTLINLQIMDKAEYKAPRNLIACTLMREADNAFISQESFDKIEGLNDTRYLKYTGNYT